MAARVQATPDPNPLQSPAVLLAEVDVSQQQKQLHDNDVHLEFMWAQQLPRSEFAGTYSVVAIAVSACGEWSSPRFIVRVD
jgi:hypothetical protein